jgi:glutaminyl-tRNA synthetase
MYDYTHCLSDSLEGITHSICTLEFEDHRPLYDWVLDNLPVACHPRQIEFARLNLSYTILSKRKLIQLVETGAVDGWDDPRMPTLSGLRRRGYTPAAILNFCELIGVAKSNSIVDIALLEHAVREDLNQHAPRAIAVLDPLRVVIENYPEDAVEEFELRNYPQDPDNSETRVVPFSRRLYIEREDFMEEAPPKFFRLAPGREVRLLGAYYVICTDVIKDETGQVVELRCRYDPESRGGQSPDGRKVKGTIHWLSAGHAVEAEVRLYNPLFTGANPDETEEGADFTSNLNPDSLERLAARVEPGLAESAPGSKFQFMRQGYFCVDTVDSTPGRPVFNRTVPLRDSWAKIQQG